MAKKKVQPTAPANEHPKGNQGCSTLYTTKLIG